MPFADYPDFDSCVSQHQDKKDPDAYCGAIKHRTEDKMKKNWIDDRDKPELEWCEVHEEWEPMSSLPVMLMHLENLRKEPSRSERTTILDSLTAMRKRLLWWFLVAGTFLAGG